MYYDQMYFVIDGKVLAIDEFGAPIICNLTQDNTPDWDSEEYIDWLELLPQTYDIYKAAIDFLQQYQSIPAYIK